MDADEGEAQLVGIKPGRTCRTGSWVTCLSFYALCSHISLMPKSFNLGFRVPGHQAQELLSWLASMLLTLPLTSKSPIAAVATASHPR